MTASEGNQFVSSIPDDGGAAGIFLNRSGARKMTLAGGRLVLPRFFPFVSTESSRPLEEQEKDILRKHYSSQTDTQPAFVESSSRSERRFDEMTSNYVTCSQCGTSQEWLQSDAFLCNFCDISRLGDKMNTNTELLRDLPPVEEVTGEHSEDGENLLHSPVRAPRYRSPFKGRITQQQETDNSEGRGRRFSSLVRRISGGKRVSQGSRSSEDLTEFAKYNHPHHQDKQGYNNHEYDARDLHRFDQGVGAS